MLNSLPTSLDNEDRLSLLLGTLVREHTILHHVISDLWSQLAGTTPASRLRPDQFAQLANDCLAMVPAVPGLADSAHAVAARSAIEFAREVNQRRNVMVHEQWVSARAVSALGAGPPASEHVDEGDFVRHRVPKRTKAVEPRGVVATPANLRDVALLVCDTMLAVDRLMALVYLIQYSAIFDEYQVRNWADVDRSELLLAAYRGTVVEEWSQSNSQ